MSKLVFIGLLALTLAGTAGGGYLLGQVTPERSALAAATGDGFTGRGAGREQMVERKAEILGMSAEELETALEGNAFLEIVEEHGLTREEMHERMGEGARARWESRGLSEEEIAERLSAREERWAERGECPGDGSGGRFGLKQ